MNKSENIVYEGKVFWVLKVKDGYEVYRKDITHSIRVSQIGTTGEEGLARAVRDCRNREGEISENNK